MLRFNLLFGTAARVGGCAFAHYKPRSPRPPADTSFGATFPQSEPCAPPFIPFPTTPPQNLKDFQPVSPEHDRFRKIYAARGRRPDLQLAETLKGISWTQKIGVSSFADIEDRIVPNPKHFLVKDILNRTHDTRRLIH